MASANQRDEPYGYLSGNTFASNISGLTRPVPPVYANLGNRLKLGGTGANRAQPFPSINTLTAMRKLTAKIQAREWIIDAIQKHDAPLDKRVQAEVRRFIKRLQRDLKSLEAEREKASWLDLMVNKDMNAAIERDRS